MRGALISLILFAISGPLYADGKITEQSVLAFMNQYQRALESEQFHTVAPLIHSKALFRFNDGDFTGMANVKSIFEKTWAIEITDNRFYFTNIKVLHIDTTSATVVFSWNWSGQTAEGQPFQVVGRGTSALAVEQGQLKILVEHLGQ